MSMQRPEVHIMLDFMQAQSRLPRAVQSKTSKLILQLKADPSANGVNWESIEGARDRHMKSARVNINYRAIVYDRGNALVLLWVDKHDDAYRWARNRVVEINPTTASVQVRTWGSSRSHKSGSLRKTRRKRRHRSCSRMSPTRIW